MAAHLMLALRHLLGDGAPLSKSLIARQLGAARAALPVTGRARFDTRVTSPARGDGVPRDDPGRHAPERPHVGTSAPL